MFYLKHIHKCWKCGLFDEESPHFSQFITKPFAGVINLQVGGLCKNCQKSMLEDVEKVIRGYFDEAGMT